MMRQTIITVTSILCLLTCSIYNAYCQVLNNRCGSAQEIILTDDYCSPPRAFTNVGATSSSQASPGCWRSTDAEQDVWFSIVPRQSGLLVRLFGEAAGSVESINSAAIAIYRGRCNNLDEVLCSNVNVGRPDVLERTVSNLDLGTRYYIRVSSAAIDAGTFQLCLFSFTPQPMPEQDCDKAIVLCDKSSFNVERLDGGGDDDDEAFGSCLSFPGTNIPSESSSTWYKWTAKTSGTLTFTLFPNNLSDPEEDLDFIVFRLPGGLEDCQNKQILRCMASGRNDGLTPAQNARCFGPTGLREGSTDIVETAGCSPGDDNFLAPLNMVVGESYALMVNNFSNSGLGFRIIFGGTGTFEGPTPDFDFQVLSGDLTCDNTIRFTDRSIASTDPIVGLDWTFGDGRVVRSTPQLDEIDVQYESIGTKTASLTLETSRGCIVTASRDLNIDNCCVEANNMIAIEIDVIDLTCFRSMNGVLQIRSGSGSSLLLYAINGSDFSVNDIYPGLAAGLYEITAQDEKGCERSFSEFISEPPPLELVLMGPTDSIPLGSTTQLFSSYSPPDRLVSYIWSPVRGLSCEDCPNPMVLPPGTTTYTLSIEDQSGCTTREDITLFTNTFKPFYAPNAIMRSSVVNRFFKLHANIAVSIVEDLSIYDRWGNLLHRMTNFDINDPSYIGWDGIVNGKIINSGVVVWVAKIRFVDDEVRIFSGDITIFD